MSYCAYCGKYVKYPESRHTWFDCEEHLKKYPEGGKLFERLGGVSFGFAEFWNDIEIDIEVLRVHEYLPIGERTYGSPTKSKEGGKTE